MATVSNYIHGNDYVHDTRRNVYMSCGIVGLKMLGNKVVPFVARTCK